MHDKGIPMDSTTLAEDERRQRAVLAHVLDRHPVHLTKEELIRELTQGREVEFAEADAIERAVEILAGAGLLHRGEDTIRPSAAALHVHILNKGE